MMTDSHSSADTETVEELREKLKDPVVVHLNMLRGGIAKLSEAQIKHLYPELFHNEPQAVSEPKVDPVAYRVKDFAEGWILCHTREVAEREADGQCLIEPLYNVPQAPLIKGAVYDLEAFGPAEYLGIDTFHGETTHHFRTKGGSRYIKPGRIASALSRPYHETETETVNKERER